MKILLIILISAFSITNYAQTNVQINWENDIEFLRTNLSERHKNLFFKKTEVEFDKGLDKIIAEKKNLSDLAIALKLQQLIASMGDSHTSINWYKLIDNKKILPIKLYWFSDGIYVINTTNKHRELLGKKVITINNYPISEIVDSLSTLITVDNRAIVISTTPQLIPISQILKYFNFSNNGVFIFEVESPQGEKFIHKIVPIQFNYQDLLKVKTDSVAFCCENTKNPFRDKYFENDFIYYIQYNHCVNKFVLYLTGRWKWAKKAPSFRKFKKQVFKTIKERNINKLIFDMQFNSGGSSIQGTKFIKQLSKDKNINQKGKLYIIVGRKTFSSAIINTLDFHEYTEGTIVGERTGGKPNHYGEVKKITLPSSQLTLFYSTKYFKRTEIELETIIPEVEIETSFKDFINGIDPIYSWIKKQ